jgi:hypothetical protein
MSRSSRRTLKQYRARLPQLAIVPAPTPIDLPPFPNSLREYLRTAAGYDGRLRPARCLVTCANARLFNELVIVGPSWRSGIIEAHVV